MSSFQCIRCGNCCRWRGWVRLTDEDIAAISKFLKIPQHEFIERHTRLHLTREALALNELPDGCCTFLEGKNICLIQPAKPLQCRTFPEKWNFTGWEKMCEGAHAICVSPAQMV